MESKFYIKTTSYYYDDQNYYPVLGRINYLDGYDTYTEAETILLELERKMFLFFQGFYDFTEIANYRSSREEHSAFVERINVFCKENFGEALIDLNDTSPDYTDWKLPENITTEQVKEFRNLTGISFYTIVVGDAIAPRLTGLYLTGNWTNQKDWMRYKGSKYNDDGKEDSGVPKFESKYVPFAYAGTEEIIRAFKSINFLFSSGDYVPKLAGTPDVLSEQPKILETMIATTKGLSLDPVSGELSVNVSDGNINWFALNDLLKEKIFELRLLSDAIVKQSNGFS